MSDDGPGCYRHVPLQWLEAKVGSLLFPASFTSFSHPRQDETLGQSVSAVRCADSVDRQWYLALVFFYTRQ